MPVIYNTTIAQMGYMTYAQAILRSNAINPAIPIQGFKPFDKLPLELARMAFKKISPADRLAVHLTCKYFKYVALGETTNGNNQSIIQKPSDREIAIDAHIRADPDLSHPKGTPAFLVCTDCAALKGPDAFAEYQFKRVRPNRYCIPCGIARGSYTGCHIDVQGKRLFPCKRCRRALPYSVKYTGAGVHKVCIGKYKYPKLCQLCKECFAYSVKEMVGCSWEDLLLVGRMASENTKG